MVDIRRLLAIEGRINRTEYIAYTFLYSLSFIIAGIAIGYAPEPAATIGSVAAIVAYAALIGALTVRRVHDMDERGWFAIILLIPLVNLYLFFSPGSPPSNRFGNPPASSSVQMKVLAVSGLVWPFLALAMILLLEDTL